MALSLPNSTDVRAFIRRTLHPRSKLGRTTLWFGYLALGLEVLRLITRSPAGTLLSGWATFICLRLRHFRPVAWLPRVRKRLMWRLRNRLIVTYVFIGVIPVILLVMMALLAGYLFAGQFATYVAMSDLQSELHHLEATNKSLADPVPQSGARRQFESAAGGGNRQRLRRKLPPSLGYRVGWRQEFRAGRAAAASAQRRLSRRPRSMETLPDSCSTTTGATARGKAGERRHPPAYRDFEYAGHPGTSAAGCLGAGIGDPVHARPGQSMPSRSCCESRALASPDAIMSPPNSAANGDGQHFQTQRPDRVEAGTVPPPAQQLRFHFPFATRFNAIDWRTGAHEAGCCWSTPGRPCCMARCSAAWGKMPASSSQALLGIGIFFGVIELIALIIGGRLTRSVTRSVAELYSATQYVNQGELQHRIRDQKPRSDGGAGAVI